MKTLNLILDVIGIVVSLFLVIGGDGDFGDYWTVYGLLVFCVLDFVIKRRRQE